MAFNASCGFRSLVTIETDQEWLASVVRREARSDYIDKRTISIGEEPSATVTFRLQAGAARLC